MTGSHIDTKKLGRIERMSHRVTGDRPDSVDVAGWEYRLATLRPAVLFSIGLMADAGVRLLR